MSSVQLKRGTASQWFTKNPILKNGELGIELDTKRIKLGNGTSQWRSLSYITVIPADLENTVGSYLEVVEKGNPGGLATLNTEGYIPDSQIPASIARDTEIVTSYNDLDDLPTLFSGSYNDLTDKPNAFSGSYNSLTDKPTLFSGSYDDLSNKPTIPSLTGYATETYVGTAISNLVDSAPEALNTLNELAAAINDDASYAATITNALGYKLDSDLAASTYAPSNSPTFTGTVAIPKLNMGTNGIEIIGTDPYLGGQFTSTIQWSGGTLYTNSNALALQVDVDNKSDKLTSISSKSASYSIASTDLGKLIEMSDGGTISIEDSASFPDGFTVDILQTGTSQVTVAGIGSTVINGTPGLKLRTRWSSATLIKRGLNLWVLLGDLAA